MKLLTACQQDLYFIFFIFSRKDRPEARFSKVPESFRTRKAKSQTLWLQNCFIYMFFKMSTEVLFLQEVSGVYTSQFLDTAKLNMALRARNVSRAFEKRAPGPNGHLAKSPRMDDCVERWSGWMCS